MLGIVGQQFLPVVLVARWAVVPTMNVIRRSGGVDACARLRAAGREAIGEIIAPVESSLSDSVLKTVFLLVSDYSLCKPHVQTCGGVRARTPTTAY